MQETRDSSVCRLLFEIVSALADHADAIRITAVDQPEGTCFSIVTHPEDVGKIVGKQGRTARSLRTIVSGIGMKSRRRYAVSIEE
jgi:hypothetical protein